MSLIGKLAGGSLISLSLLINNCGKLGVEVDDPDRGTIRGTVRTERGTPRPAYVWFTNSKYKSCKSSENPYVTKANNSGEYILEVPVGAYNVHGCQLSAGFGGGYGTMGAVAERGKTNVIEGPVLSIYSSFYPSCVTECK